MRPCGGHSLPLTASVLGNNYGKEIWRMRYRKARMIPRRLRGGRAPSNVSRREMSAIAGEARAPFSTPAGGGASKASPADGREGPGATPEPAERAAVNYITSLRSLSRIRPRSLRQWIIDAPRDFRHRATPVPLNYHGSRCTVRRFPEIPRPFPDCRSEGDNGRNRPKTSKEPDEQINKPKLDRRTI